MNLLELRNVTKSFPLNGQNLKVLDNISLIIKKGEFIAISGPSGSGKSTLMYIMGCLDTPTSGQILLEGRNLSGLSEQELAKVRNKKIGFIFQTFNLLPRTSALANVMLPLIYAQTSRTEREQKARQTLEKLGLGDRLTHSPNKLSGGEQQRVAIARALINEPEFLLADEPTGNLDSKSGRDVMEIIRKIHQEGKTIILVTHDPDIAKYAQRIIRIKDGKIN